MCQRIDWAMGNVTKNVSKAGVSNAEMYILLTALQNTVSALQSTVNSQGASISALMQSVTVLGNDYTALEQRVAALETRHKEDAYGYTENKKRRPAALWAQ